MSPDLVSPFVVVADVLIAVLGGAIVLLAYRASRRTDRASMRLFTAGFAMVTASLLVGGTLGLGSGTGWTLLRATLAVVGLGLLAASLFVGRVDEVRDRGEPAR